MDRLSASPDTLIAVLSTVTFLYPSAFWLLLALPLLWWIAPTRRLSHAALRAAVLGSLILALAQPSVIYRSGAAPQIYLVDQRDDLSPAARAAIRAALANRLAGAPAGPRTILQLGGKPVPASTADTHRMLPAGSLSLGLERALETLPLGAGGITLISDGRSTDRHWDRAVAALIARDIPVDTIAVADPVARAFVAGIDAAPVRVGERAVVTVAVVGDDRPHTLTLTQEGRAIGSAAVVTAGESVLRFAVPAERPGFMSIRATLSDTGGVAGATMDGVVAVQDPLRVLYLGDRQRGAAPRLRRLLGDGFAIDQGDPRAIGIGQDVMRYPLVVLDDVPANAISAVGQRALMQAVTIRDTGLMVTGGDAVFGGGGYARSALGPLLPVRPRPEEKVEDPSVALVIVIDTSGSMDGNLIEMAKQIARRTAAKLKPADQLGVVEFYGAQQWAIPLQPVADPIGVDRAISRLKAQGSTVLYPAIQEAYYGLKDVTARYRHILVITDGGVEESRYSKLLGQAAQDRINVSTVQVGTDTSASESMANWARIGRGRFYSVPDENGLVEVDFRQPQVKPEPDYRAGVSVLRDTASPLWWRSAGIASIPPVGGHARVTARPEAEALLATTSGDPVLATWQHGGGRVTALMTEPLGAGGAPWAGWRDYGRWLARVAAMTARQRPAATITLDRRFGRLRIAVQQLDGQAGPPSTIRFVGFDGRAVAGVSGLEARAPGLFVADVPWPADRPALVEATDEDGRTVRAADRAASDVSATGAVPPSRALPMARLAELTDGRFADGQVAAATAPPARPGGLATVDLWPWLALLGLLLYFADLYLRRTPRRRAPLMATR